MIFSPMWTIQICVSDKLKIPPKDPWAHLAPKVHLQVKVKYWKCNFLSALHFPEIEGSRFGTSRLQRLSLKSLISLWKFNVCLKIIVQIFDLPLKNHSFCKDCCANLWFSFEKQINFSPGRVIQICVSNKLQTPPNDPLDTFGSESAFASKGFVLQMSLSERPPFSRN